MSRASRRPAYVSLEEVQRHSEPDDLWMILYNKVYDLTNFAKNHIGGIEVLYDCGGSDATEAFEDVGHSDFAIDMLEPFYVGEVEPEQRKSYRSCNLIFESKNETSVTSSKGTIATSSVVASSIKQLKEISIRIQDSISLFWLTFIALTSFTLLVLIQQLK
ncbi:hypothetical protein PVL30_003331 [Lodderomyces elongisporus]|uniref:uncharacterized protein n=1 Tax=Lodderomyces elongisporus TaxID=36914 RepID=UPI00291E1032|nr:uncharacterized protein PVL30_003331 [Lodderomyces elongisporus]WLF79575.1 hypothetical protein PVL30_003331 [Lodderomyces elongisporus]